MKRTSYYVTEASAEAIEAAVERITKALGGGLPKQVVLSALLTAAAEQADAVTQQLAAAQAESLAQRLEALRRTGTTEP